jgi:hypothetical protein
LCCEEAVRTSLPKRIHSNPPAMATEGPKKIRWVLAHEPIELFLRAAQRFKATMEASAPGELEYGAWQTIRDIS